MKRADCMWGWDMCQFETDQDGDVNADEETNHGGNLIIVFADRSVAEEHTNCRRYSNGILESQSWCGMIESHVDWIG